MILAGDIGGTHARLAFFDVVDGHFSLVSASVFPSREYRGLDKIVTKFVDSSNVRPDAACFGVAGPIRNGRVEASKTGDRKSTRLNSSHQIISYAVFCLKKKTGRGNKRSISSSTST